MVAGRCSSDRCRLGRRWPLRGGGSGVTALRTPERRWQGRGVVAVYGALSPLGARATAINTKAAPEGRLSYLSRRRPTLPGLLKPSTIGAEGLNFSVRNGKRCFPLAIATGNRESPPAGLENCSAKPGYHSPTALPAEQKIRQALVPLVPVSFTCHHASRSGLSTWWSTRVLTPSMGMGELISRPASRLDAFSGYPIHT